MKPLSPTAENTLQHVRELAAGERTTAAHPRRRTTYQLIRSGRQLRYLCEVRNPQALPLGWRLLFHR